MHLAREHARRIAISAALLDARRPSDLLSMVAHLGMLRVELTPTVAPAADHVAFSRLGQTFEPSQLTEAVSRGDLFERGWMLRPMADLGLFLGGMATYADRSNTRGWLESNARFVRDILNRIDEEGPLTSDDVPDTAVVPWKSTGWNNNRNVPLMLETLHLTGELAVVGREGRLRVWQLASKVYPDVPEVPADEARRIRSERLLTSFGVMRDSIAVAPLELHGNDRVGQRVSIEGVPGTWLVDPAQLDGSDGTAFEGRTAILSPFDRLMTDRQRLAHLFEYDYAIEMYKPVEQRIWGKFALPILQGDRLVGKVDATSDRKRGRFVVHRIIEDEPLDRAAVEAELDEFATWLGLER